MDAERWKHVERALQSALDVRALPRSAGAAGTFLSGPAIGVAAKAAARHQPDQLAAPPTFSRTCRG